MPQWHKSNSGVDQITVCIFVGAQAPHACSRSCFVACITYSLRNRLHFAYAIHSAIQSEKYTGISFSHFKCVGKSTTNFMHSRKKGYDGIFNRLLFIIHAQNRIDFSELNSIQNILPGKKTPTVIFLLALTVRSMKVYNKSDKR